MSKLANLCMIAFLLFLTITQATARAGPAFHDVTPMKTGHEDDEEVKVDVEENCSGLGEEECLMRRTLAAHVDYIYTQGKKHN